MARALKIPQVVADDFQSRYCRGPSAAYPCLPQYWNWIAEQLQTTHIITTPFGRRRHFFSRPDDDATLREAIAFVPQSTTADRMNLGLWRTWKYEPRAELLAQTYDSITFQYDERHDESEIVGHVLELIRVELRSNSGRRYIVPGEAKVGWNWGGQVIQADVDRAIARGKRPPHFNPDGLIKFKPGKPDTRTRTTDLNRIMF